MFEKLEAKARWEQICADVWSNTGPPREAAACAEWIEKNCMPPHDIAQVEAFDGDPRNSCLGAPDAEHCAGLLRDPGQFEYDDDHLMPGRSLCAVVSKALSTCGPHGHWRSHRADYPALLQSLALFDSHGPVVRAVTAQADAGRVDIAAIALRGAARGLL